MYSETNLPRAVLSQNPHDVNWDRNWAAAVGSRRLTGGNAARRTSTQRAEEQSEIIWDMFLQDCNNINIYRDKCRGTPWPLVRKRTTPNERPPLSAKFSANFADREVSRDQRGGSPTVINLSFLDRSCYFSFK
jgi:hypothetical protein